MSLTCARRGDNDQPLIFVHGSSGSAASYGALVDSLAWPGSTWLYDAPGLAGEEQLFTGSFAERGQSYARAISERCGTESVRLAGWAMGGVLAVEIARALAEDGADVRFVGVIDGRAPQPEMKNRPRDAGSMARFFLMSSARTAGKSAPPIPDPLNADTIYDALSAADALGAMTSRDLLARYLAVFSTLAPSFMVHDMKRLDMDIDVFVSSDEDPSHPKPPTLGWEDVARTQHLHSVPGTHFTVLDAAFTADLARRMKDAILARETDALPW